MEQNSIPAVKRDLPSIETLFSLAMERFKERFFNYFLLLLIGFGVSIVFFLVLGLVGFGLPMVVFTEPGQVPLVMGITVIANIIFWLAYFIYLAPWFVLSVIHVMVSSEKTSPIQALKETRPHVFSFFGFTFLSSLFLFGLTPFMLITLYVVSLLWTIWGAFSYFVFLEEKRGGMYPLWASYARINQDFWPMVSKIAVPFIILMVISFVLGFLSIIPLIGLLFIVLIFIITICLGPLITSYLYELYKTTKKPEVVQAPKIWVILSVVGFIITMIIIAVVSVLIITFVTNEKFIERFQEGFQEAETSGEFDFDPGSDVNIDIDTEDINVVTPSAGEDNQQNGNNNTQDQLDDSTLNQLEGIEGLQQLEQLAETYNSLPPFLQDQIDAEIQAQLDQLPADQRAIAEEYMEALLNPEDQPTEPTPAE